MPARDIERMNPEVMAAILPRIYPQMLDEVHAHQDAGRATFIVSAAGNGVVEPLARVLGMDGGIGTRYEVDADGSLHRPLRRALRLRRRARSRRCENFAAEHDIDLGRSYAYSDSLSDLPMLRGGRQPGGRQPRPGAGGDRQARGLADDALRAPRPPPARDRGHRPGDDRRLRRFVDRAQESSPAATIPTSPLGLSGAGGRSQFDYRSATGRQHRRARSNLAWSRPDVPDERMRMKRALLALAVLVAAMLPLAAIAAADGNGGPDDHGGARGKAVTYAVIGDTPYGTPQLENFPNDVAEINADPRSAW